VSTTIDLPTILGTEEGIDALAKFIGKSNAFTKTGEPPGGWAEEDQDQEAREEDPEDEDDGAPNGEEDQGQDEGEAERENEDDEE